MPKHVLHPEANEMTFNSKVAPVMARERDGEGKSIVTSVQETNDEGVPLWDVGVRCDTENFGVEDEEVIKFRIPLRSKPQTTKNAPAVFKNPTVSFYAKRSGDLMRFYSADGIVTPGSEQK